MRQVIPALILACFVPLAVRAERIDDGINVTGSIKSTGTCPTGAGTVTVSTSGIATVGLNVAGTFSATLALQGSIDGTNLVSLAAYPAGGGAGTSSITGTGQWLVGAAGLKWVCVYGSAYVSGTATISMEPSPISSTMLPQTWGQANSGTAGVILLNAVSSTGAGVAYVNSNGYTAHDFTITTTGSPTYTISFQGSNDNTNWQTIDTVTASSTTPNFVGSAGFFVYLRANLTALSGGTLTATYSGAVLESPQVSIVGQTAGKTGVQSQGVDPVTGLAQNLAVDATSNGLYVTDAATTANTAVTQATFTANTALNIKASGGNVYGISAQNAAASVCWLQFYNTSGTPTCGTSVVWAVALPVTPGIFNMGPGPIPMGNFTSGIGICVSTTPTGSTTCGSTANGTIFFK